ncbi:MAG: glycosyltransferase [Prochlorotrichaceae cyanobacterium]
MIWVLSLSLLIWLILILFWGQFWRCDQRLQSNSGNTALNSQAAHSQALPTIAAVIPARNEAEVIETSIRSLLSQDYPGNLSITVVDDQSEDGTATLVMNLNPEASAQNRSLQVLAGKPLPSGWTGKLWALEQGTQQVIASQNPDFIWLTDADIAHAPQSLRQLVQKAQAQDLGLISLMVQLRCQSFWEKLLIPAFIFFFQKLYPFPWVNDPQRSMAAAAGGCILIQRSVLEQIGGIAALREALIDDCTLAQKVKTVSRPFVPIWLGLSEETVSLRAYESLDSIWTMVARTAYTQLNYSPLLLLGTIVGMSLVYLVAPLGVLYGSITQQWGLLGLGLLLWGCMTIAYTPTVKLYRLSPLWAWTLPGIAFLYSLMTIDSARRHWMGKGGAWKGRVYR